MSLEDIYNDVSKSMEDKKPALIEFMETHIDFETIIPTSFYNVLYRHRVVVERTINLVKESFVLDSRKTFRSVSIPMCYYTVGWCAAGRFYPQL